MDFGTASVACGACVLAAPLILLVLLGAASLFGRRLPETTIARFTQFAIVIGLSAATIVLLMMLWTGVRFVPVVFGDWVFLPEAQFQVRMKFVFDRLSVPFAILTFVLVGTTAAFASRYLHREPGFARFFFLQAMFLFGMIVASLSGTIEALFLGWEMVGLSSALLVAFFHERTAPVINGQRIWSVYRLADAAFLMAAVAMHRMTGEGDFTALTGSGPWPDGHATLPGNEVLLVGFLLLIAAAGKSALIPFSGWLPRAMEGPTPSSAIFYGALSVHLGAFLLLRASALFELSIILKAAVIALGLGSALFGAMAARVQSDIKSVLAFASLTQVGIITAEIGFGFRYIALIHIIGHASLRTLQLLRAPTLLRDYQTLENALGCHLSHRSESWDRWIPERFSLHLYRVSLERGSWDALLNEYIVRPFVNLFEWFDHREREWIRFLSEAGRTPPDRHVHDLTPPVRRERQSSESLATKDLA